MTTHELANLLLKGDNVEVEMWNDDLEEWSSVSITSLIRLIPVRKEEKD